MIVTGGFQSGVSLHACAADAQYVNNQATKVTRKRVDDDALMEIRAEFREVEVISESASTAASNRQGGDCTLRRAGSPIRCGGLPVR